MSKEKTASTEVSKEITEEQWLDGVNKLAEEKANELAIAFKCKVTPFVFVVDPLKDVAIGYMKTPDAVQSLKIFRVMMENADLGCVLAVKSQLIREPDLAGLGLQGEASDKRFMDVNGNYENEWSGLNFSLLLKGQAIIDIFVDKFKKK